ncbi:proteinase inhibitor I4 serpin [Streptomyces sp. t39]|uniref:proteinase inhibitor I4 serpin n=1 Tax=Streptomyces sp. t39 TaxID=1828156 RepID=UPI0021C7609B|nr:proteinase inhibitor I4 serpin [Streptomyces sp. t39]
MRAVNGLTARWAAAADGDDDTVFSAAGLWPLLALLGDAADERTRPALEDAVGMAVRDAAPAARELTAALADVRGMRSATGLWAAEGLPLRPAWVAGLPSDVLGRLTGDPVADGAALDAWASARTGGMIGAMPPVRTERTELVLAAAQALRTRWLQGFRESRLRPSDGPWAGRTLAGLVRTTSLLAGLGVAATDAGPVSVLRVLGDTGVDVHLLLGDAGMAPGAVLEGGVGVLSGRCAAVPADRLPIGDAGPGVVVATAPSTGPNPQLHALVSPFRLRSDHDLLKRDAPAGLSAALGGGRFPGIGPRPPVLGAAAQSAMAVFDAEGFETASVSAVGTRTGRGPRAARHVVRRVEAVYDRPFGFLTVHRASSLVLSAGWVARPTPYAPSSGPGA